MGRRYRILRCEVLESRFCLSGDPRVVGDSFPTFIDPINELDTDSFDERRDTGFIWKQVHAEAAYARAEETSDSESGSARGYEQSVEAEAHLSVFGLNIGLLELSVDAGTALGAQQVTLEEPSQVGSVVETNEGILTLSAHGQGLVYLVIGGSLELTEVEAAWSRESDTAPRVESQATDSVTVDFQVQFIALGDYSFEITIEALHRTLWAAQTEEAQPLTVASELRSSHVEVTTEAMVYLISGSYSQRAENRFEATAAATDVVFAETEVDWHLVGRGTSHLESGASLSDFVGWYQGTPERGHQHFANAWTSLSIPAGWASGTGTAYLSARAHNAPFRDTTVSLRLFSDGGAADVASDSITSRWDQESDLVAEGRVLAADIGQAVPFRWWQ